MKFSNTLRSGAAALAVLGLLAVSPSSYAAPGDSADVVHNAHVSVIKAGMSGAEVERLLGKPTSKPKWLNGTTTWTYETDDWKQRCDVDFGTDGKVKGTMLYQRASSGNT